MNFKDKLTNLIKNIVESDFNAEFEEHEIGNQKYYRLHYINYHNISNGGERGIIDWSYKPFELPKDMTREEGFKVLSYLTDFIEKRDGVDEASWKSVGILDSVIDIERFGFNRTMITPSEEEIIDLFSVGGRIKRFKNSKYYNKYFNWYTPNITKEEVERIYQNCGCTFSDIVWVDNNTKGDNEKILIKKK